MQLILLFDLVRPVVDLVQLAPYHVSPAPPVLSALFVTSPADAARLIMAYREAADGGRICAATIAFAASRLLGIVSEWWRELHGIVSESRMSMQAWRLGPSPLTGPKSWHSENCETT